MLQNTSVTGQADDEGFSFRSDHLALDFVATRMYRDQPVETLELLTEPEALASWAIAAGALTRTPAQLSMCVLEDAIVAREAIYRVAVALIAETPMPAEALNVLNQVADDTPVRLALDEHGAIQRSGSLKNLVVSIVREAIELFGGANGSRIRQCARDGCSRLFIDRTRGATRIWCGMRECGNRVNAAAYRQRRAVSESAGQPGTQ